MGACSSPLRGRLGAGVRRALRDGALPLTPPPPRGQGRNSMSVTILFLGPLRDLAGVPQAEYPAPLDWEGLLAAVPPAVAEQLAEPRVHVACAGKVLSDKADLDAQDGDEVALLPPVSGG